MTMDKLRLLILDLLKVRGPSKEERNVADFVKAFCRKRGLSVREDDVHRRIGGTTGNLLVFPKKTKPGQATLLFASHLDTVDVGPCPKGMVKKGKIRGEGKYPVGLDNRLGVALMLKLL